MRADLTGAHLARVASDREVADEFAALTHHEVVILVLVRLHGREGRLQTRDRDPVVVMSEANELSDTNGSFEVLLHVFVREKQNVRFVTMRPPRSEVRVVRAALDEVPLAERLDVDRTWLENQPSRKRYAETSASRGSRTELDRLRMRSVDQRHWGTPVHTGTGMPPFIDTSLRVHRLIAGPK